MKQHEVQPNKSLWRQAERYRKQRNAILVASTLTLSSVFMIESHMFTKQEEAFRSMHDLVIEYRTNCDKHSLQIQQLTDENKELKLLNSDLTKKLQNRVTAPTDEYIQQYWMIPVDTSAKIYTALPLSADMQQYTYAMCKQFGIEDYYETCLAIMWQETHFDPTLVSQTNDYGLMQINQCNLTDLQRELGITDIMQPDQNICSGVYIVSLLAKQFDNKHEVLMAYNMGPASMLRLIEQGIYSSAYSRSVVSKTQMILQNEYDPD